MIKKVLKNYLLKKIDEETDLLWDEGVLDQRRLDELRHEDLHKGKVSRQDVIDRQL